VSSVEPTTSMKSEVTAAAPRVPYLPRAECYERYSGTDPAVPSRARRYERSVRRSVGGENVLRSPSFVNADDGLATIEYIIGAAVVLGTLAIGVQAWNNGLVARLQDLVAQMGAVR
jgi:hypothetical protein